MTLVPWEIGPNSEREDGLAIQAASPFEEGRGYIGLAEALGRRERARICR